MRILLTRPMEDSQRVADFLKPLGHTVDIEPLLSIQHLDVPLQLAGIQALLFTSANGVRAFMRLEAGRHWQVFTVGAQSKKIAQEAGFQIIFSADGNAQDLAQLIKARLSPKDGPLFHGAGGFGSGALKEELEKSGFAVKRQALYESAASKGFSEETLNRLKTGIYDFILFFSPRTARIFGNLCAKGAIGGLSHSTALALSDAVGAELEEIGFKSLRIAEKPDLPSLLALMDSIIRKG